MVTEIPPKLDLALVDAGFKAMLGRRHSAIWLNGSRTSDAMLARRRFDTLQRLGLAPPRFKDSDRFINIDNFPIHGQNYQFFEQAIAPRPPAVLNLRAVARRAPLRGHAFA